MRTRLIATVAALPLLCGLTAATATAATRSHAPVAQAATSPCGTVTTPPAYKHVIVLFMENFSYGNIWKSSNAPYINSLGTECGIASNYHNLSHDSADNYIGASYGGSVSAISKFDGDCDPAPSCDVTTTNIFNQANSLPGGWKSYSESMPKNCDKSDSGQYAPKHNPAPYYTDLTDCATDNVPLGTTSSSPLLTDFGSQATAPAYSWLTPNLCDDMHGNSGCPSTNEIKQGDTWLSKWIPLITSTSVYQSGNTAIFLTWDEGAGGNEGENCSHNTSDQSCHVLFIAIAPSVKAGTVVTTQLNHYSLLKASEDLLGLPELNEAKTATSLTKAFNLAP